MISDMDNVIYHPGEYSVVTNTTILLEYPMLDDLKIKSVISTLQHNTKHVTLKLLDEEAIIIAPNKIYRFVYDGGYLN